MIRKTEHCFNDQKNDFNEAKIERQFIINTRKKHSKFLGKRWKEKSAEQCCNNWTDLWKKETKRKTAKENFDSLSAWLEEIGDEPIHSVIDGKMWRS